jgi:hypothetical protein
MTFLKTITGGYITMFMIFRKITASLLLLTTLLFVAAGAAPAIAASTKTVQKSFTSPDEALKGLVQAVRENNFKELHAILGPDSKDIISSGDPVADKAGREHFVKLYDEKIVIEGADTGRAIFSIGSDNFPYPIPLVKKGNVWHFDVAAGREELLNRRIGRNELEVIEILRAYVDAQREYATTDWDGDGATEFAQKIRSTEGKKDGLYWAAKDGEKLSPLGPLAAKAAREGYSKENTALHGYYFKILKAQGKDAVGGAFDYLVNGKMILGYAMEAYPAKFGASGVMTFIVNHTGVVYQKNLGKNGGTVAESMKQFNPDKSWKKVK